MFGLLALSSCGQKPATEERSSGPSNSFSHEVLVLADVSLKPTLEDLAARYQQETADYIRFIFAPSAAIRPDTPGDSVDVYILANSNFMFQPGDTLAADPNYRLEIAYSIPCIVVPQLNPALVSNLSDLVNPGIRLGIADPDSDILGAFALEILEKNGLLEAVEPKLIHVGPSALDLSQRIASKEMEAAIGWIVFANWAEGVNDVILLTSDEIPRIAVISAWRAAHPRDEAAAARLMTFLDNDRCAETFRHWGYMTSRADLEMYATAAQIGGDPVFPELASR